MKLLGMIQGFVSHPTKSKLTALLLQYNSVTNLAHNGGFWLNKFYSPHYADVGPTHPDLLMGVVGAEVFRIRVGLDYYKKGLAQFDGEGMRQTPRLKLGRGKCVRWAPPPAEPISPTPPSEAI